MSNERIEMRGGERCIVDDAGVIAVVFGDDPAEARAILRDMQRRAAVAELIEAAIDAHDFAANIARNEGEELDRRFYRLRAALARVQGGDR